MLNIPVTSTGSATVGLLQTAVTSPPLLLSASPSLPFSPTNHAALPLGQSGPGPSDLPWSPRLGSGDPLAPRPAPQVPRWVAHEERKGNLGRGSPGSCPLTSGCVEEWSV